MGGISSLCLSKQNQRGIQNIDELPSTIEHIDDFYKIIPRLLSMDQSEFKRIYKQSKKPKYTKKLSNKQKNLNNNDIQNDSDDIKLELIDVPSCKLQDSFILKCKYLINSASVLSLVIVKDIIFQIQIIPHHIRYIHEYNNYYLDQLKQRYVSLEELIMIHYGSISCLYTTINILLYIGYESESECNHLVLPYNNLSYLDDIKFHISLKEKLRLNTLDYEQYKLEDKRYILYEKLSISQEQEMDDNDEYDDDIADVDDVYLLVSGYLEGIAIKYCVINDIISLCIKFYLISNDSNYMNMLSFSQRDYPYSNALKLDVYNFVNGNKYSLNIQGLNSDGTHYMYLVRKISLPRWIKDDIVDLGQPRSIYDDAYFRVMNSNNLCVIYDQITYQTFNWMVNVNGGRTRSMNNKQAMIVFDPLYPEYGGYNIEFAKSFALNLYLWKADRKIYHRNRNSMICLNRIGSKSTLSEYDIDCNKYIALNGQLQYDRCEGSGMCLFGDNESKLLLCGGHTPCNHHLINRKCKCCTLKTCEIYDIYNEYDHEYHANISSMNLARMNHAMLYEKELQQIIVGGGQDKEIFNINNNNHPINIKEIDSYRNKYRYLTPHTVEILDLNKNRWKLIECKTQNGYASNPYLFYNNSNPFIINIFNSYLSYSGSRANHSEFIDIREQKKWIQNNNINNYLKQNDTFHISMF